MRPDPLLQRAVKRGVRLIGGCRVACNDFGIVMSKEKQQECGAFTLESVACYWKVERR